MIPERSSPRRRGHRDRRGLRDRHPIHGWAKPPTGSGRRSCGFTQRCCGCKRCCWQNRPLPFPPGSSGWWPRLPTRCGSRSGRCCPGSVRSSRADRRLPMSGDRRRYLAYEVQRLCGRGRSLREIAKALSISRRTVKNLLEETEKRRQEGESAAQREIPVPVPRGSSLDQHQERMKEWIEKFGRKLTAVRCLEMLKQHGFTGGYTIVRQRLKELRLEVIPPRPTATEVVTAPGQRGEFDWSPYKLDGRIRVELFHVVLRWSRAPALFAAQDTRQTTTFRFLRQAFEEWGGVPTEMLTDSMPGVVDRWELDQPVLNLRYIDFAAHYRFTALIAPRACPKWKAVCERRFRHHEENLLSGRDLRSFAEYL
ncbi:MAG: IS21 family transposase, partial [Gammaproteobacteria bacterium]